MADTIRPDRHNSRYVILAALAAAALSALSVTSACLHANVISITAAALNCLISVVIAGMVFWTRRQENRSAFYKNQIARHFERLRHSHD